MLFLLRFSEAEFVTSLIFKRFKKNYGLEPVKTDLSASPIELKVVFLEIVYLDLYSDKFWGFSIFSFCTPPGDIYGWPLVPIKKYAEIKGGRLSTV